MAVTKRPDVKHYKEGQIEPIDFIISNDLSFAEGNVVKYITRYKHKGTPVEDLRKAKDYIDFILETYDTPIIVTNLVEMENLGDTLYDILQALCSTNVICRGYSLDVYLNARGIPYSVLMDTNEYVIRDIFRLNYIRHHDELTYSDLIYREA